MLAGEGKLSRALTRARPTFSSGGVAAATTTSKNLENESALRRASRPGRADERDDVGRIGDDIGDGRAILGAKWWRLSFLSSSSLYSSADTRAVCTFSKVSRMERTSSGFLAACTSTRRSLIADSTIGSPRRKRPSARARISASRRIFSAARDSSAPRRACSPSCSHSMLASLDNGVTSAFPNRTCANACALIALLSAASRALGASFELLLATIAALSETSADSPGDDHPGCSLVMSLV